MARGRAGGSSTHACNSAGGVASHRQRGEVEPAPALDVRAVRQARQLAVPDGQKIGPPNRGDQPLPARDILRVIRLFSRDDGRRQRQPHRVERAQDGFELAQVRALVLAAPEAQQPVFVLGLVIDRSRGQIDPGGLGRQGIGADQMLPQFGLNGLAGAGLRVAQLGQQHRQSVIRAVLGPDGFAQRLAQTGEMLRRPFFDRAQKVRTTHDRMRDEHHRQFAVAQACPVPMWRLQYLVNDGIYPHVPEPIDQQRQFVNPF